MRDNNTQLDRLSRRGFLKLLTAAGCVYSFNSAIERLAYPTRYISSDAEKPNFIIIVLDSLTARHLSLHGYPRQTTPNFERIAAQALVYHQHHAPGNYTTPSTASVITGVYPWKHRSVQFRSFFRPQANTQSIFRLTQAYKSFAYTHNTMAHVHLHAIRRHIDELLSPEQLSLYSSSMTEQFFGRDYAVATSAEDILFWKGRKPAGAFVSSLINKWVRNNKEAELNRIYGDMFPRGLPREEHEEPSAFRVFTIEDSVNWIITQAKEYQSPYLGYIHLLPPHIPYRTRKEFYNQFFQDGFSPIQKPAHFFNNRHNQEFLGELRREYDETILYADAEMGRLYDELKKAGSLKNTWLIITSDHGEMFERGIWGHITPTLYEALLHIPLLIVPPEQNERIDIHTLTSSVDLLPSLAFLAGAKTHPDWDGQILPGLGAPAQTSPRPIFAIDAKESSATDPLRKASLAVFLENFKLILYHGYDQFPIQHELYDLKNDPEELEDLSNTRRDMVEMMTQVLKQEINRAGLELS